MTPTFENLDFREKIILKNRQFIEKYANYSVNMKQISDKYHQLISGFERKK
jgi:hypothetical protein